MKLYAPAAERNRGPILEALRRSLPLSPRVLEIGSGTGQHAAHFVANWPGLVWQPTEASEEGLASIAAYREALGDARLRPPLHLDVRRDPWPEGRWDAVFSANVIHIAPFDVCEAIIAEAGRCIEAGGRLVLYGPFRRGGVLAPESNVAFDAWLKERDPSFGVRDLETVAALARSAGFGEPTVEPMPANNYLVVFVRERNEARARVLTCASCGGAVDETARRCGYCRAPVATLRCAHCFHMNVASAAHCSGCGDPLGLEPIAKLGDLDCPECRRPMAVFKGGPGKLWDCDDCGGQFLEHALVQDLIRRREVIGRAVPVHVPRHNPLAQPVRYQACPACAQLMNRRNFGGTSGVIVDECRPHGMWFDSGELPRVLAFVESGGLAQARRREIASLEAQNRPITATMQTETPVLWAEHRASFLADVAEATVVLLDAVIGALGRAAGR
jgi:SAM-dependent methyltransferase/Zn-finger nucleic acid-binding protein